MICKDCGKEFHRNKSILNPDFCDECIHKILQKIIRKLKYQIKYYRRRNRFYE